MEWSVGHIATKRAMFTPDKTAIIFEDTPITYKEINRHANQAAHYLKQAGLKKGDRLAVDLMNCPEFVYLYFAAAKLGFIFVPLNFRLVGPEIEYQLNNCGARILFFHDAFAPVIDSIRTTVLVESNKFIWLKSRKLKTSDCPAWAAEYEEIVNRFPDAEPIPDQPVHVDDPLAIIYTSGVTGAPKGACVSHNQTYYKNLQNMLYAGLRPEDVSLSQLPLFHSGGLFISLTPSMMAGLTLLMRQSFDPVKFAEDIQTYRATVVFALTTMWKIILDTGKLKQIDTSSVRKVLGGGERTPASMIEALAEQNIYMEQGFGQTENSYMMKLPRKDIFRKMGSVGLPGYCSDIWIADEKFKPMPPGQIGEIVARGPTVMSGYWNMPEQTEKAIVNGVLKTGDLGYMDEEGYFYIVDRAKSMYRSGGENVYPAEVEKALSAHPKIQHVAIVGVPDGRWGETGKAYVVPVEGETLTLEEVHAFLRDRLARFKHPTIIELLKEMPMTASGKIKRAELQPTSVSNKEAS